MKYMKHHQLQLADRKPDWRAPVFQGNNAVMFQDRLQGRSATMFLARFKDKNGSRRVKEQVCRNIPREACFNVPRQECQNVSRIQQNTMQLSSKGKMQKCSKGTKQKCSTGKIQTDSQYTMPQCFSAAVKKYPDHPIPKPSELKSKF